MLVRGFLNSPCWFRILPTTLIFWWRQSFLLGHWYLCFWLLVGYPLGSRPEWATLFMLGTRFIFVCCGSLWGITPVVISWVTSQFRNNNKDKSSSPEVEHYLLKNSSSQNNKYSKKSNEWVPCEIQIFPLNIILHGWPLPADPTSSCCRLTLVSRRSLLVCMPTMRNVNGTAHWWYVLHFTENLLAASMAAESVSSMYLWAGIGEIWNWPHSKRPGRCSMGWAMSVRFHLQHFRCYPITTPKNYIHGLLSMCRFDNTYKLKTVEFGYHTSFSKIIKKSQWIFGCCSVHCKFHWCWWSTMNIVQVNAKLVHPKDQGVRNIVIMAEDKWANLWYEHYMDKLFL